MTKLKNNNGKYLYNIEFLLVVQIRRIFRNTSHFVQTSSTG